ncbi:hypothetical protein PILCRDRAFT_15949 [Piloderma croceum F 1598]|uniref:Uncharacterized protein n=1 Tax=Piloderma croceum (strain F 1598) TaxID=765440 RepID=A0A0C3EXH6_PILCF|nr:hypothetical protein PILCRDRAFT_15949 [Piloderma croceum F 1598]
MFSLQPGSNQQSMSKGQCPCKDMMASAVNSFLQSPSTTPDVIKALDADGCKHVYSAIFDGDLSDVEDEEVASGRGWHRKRPSESVFDQGGRVTVKKITRISRQVKKAVCVAKVNRVDFPDFDFHLATTKCIRPKPPTTTITWEDNILKSGHSKDKVMLIYYLPRFTPKNTLDHLHEGLIEMAKIDSPHRGKTKTSKEKVGIFVDREGEITGEKRIVKEDIVPCPEFRQSGKGMDATCRTVQLLEIVSYMVNTFLEHADPEHYKEALALRDLICRARLSYDALADWDVLVYEGREILYNRKSGLHTDSQDPHLSWAILVAAGSHSGGHVHLSHLGLGVRLQPGDMTAIRGRVIPHEIED